VIRVIYQAYTVYEFQDCIHWGYYNPVSDLIFDGVSGYATVISKNCFAMVPMPAWWRRIIGVFR